MDSRKKILALGAMSGTSLDGLDLALCSFSCVKGKWSFELRKSKCISYSKDQVHFLKNLENISSEDLIKGHIEFGKYLGKMVNDFLKNEEIPDLIASHGHTIFHQPHLGYTFQAGHGQEIANICKVPVISDFRQKDISMGGQGAPLVPIGDLHLFQEFDTCINVGGFANISIKKDSSVTAFDICPANYVLNYLSNKIGHDFDKGGQIAKSGQIQTELLSKLNALKYYTKKPPKSLGREWVEKIIFPLLVGYDCSIENKISTFTEHIAIQLSQSLNNSKTCLVTGGGAYNNHLINRIKELSSSSIQVPSNSIVEFKEAIVFGFLGALFNANQANCLGSVTGATADSIGGVLHLP